MTGPTAEDGTMPDTVLSVALPEPLGEHVRERAAQGGYGDPGDYVRALIAEDMRQRAEEERVDALLLEGLNSGPAEPMTREDWDYIRAEAQRRARRPTPLEA
jgi:antitoxin ParD1/3/4